MTDPDCERAGRADRTAPRIDLTSPALWAFLGEFPSAGLALGGWLLGEREGPEPLDASDADRR
jgi:hypothetical protein